MSAVDTPLRPLTLLVLALGGEGGGVLADWIVDAAIAAGYPVQGTSVPGVAQRTGATSYYIEMLPVPLAQLGGRAPVFCLSPALGQIDLLVSSELLETGRALERGLATPDRTLLISATSRFLTVAEKMAQGDGRYRDDGIARAAQLASRQSVLFDMNEATRQAGTVISAVMFGAIAASGVLPLTRAQCEAQIRAGGRGADASLRGFAAGFDATLAGLADAASPVAVSPAVAPAVVAGPGPVAAMSPVTAGVAAAPRPIDVAGVAMPPPVAAIARLGFARMVEYQDAGYGRLYLQRVAAMVAAERQAPGADGQFAASCEGARLLALWMAYEDLIRVADLKTRASRFARIRDEVGAAPGEPVVVRDFLKPGLDEIAAILPPGLAHRLNGWAQRRGRRELSDGIRLQTSAVGGLLLMRLLASLRRIRRSSLRYADEQQLIERWHRALLAALPVSLPLALAIAKAPRLIKGYSDTFARGRGQFVDILATLVEAPLPVAGGSDAAAQMAQRAQAIDGACAAAQADPQGRALAAALGRPAPAPAVHKIHFTPKRRPG